ncbi:Uncharacterized protein PCOAH_00020230 [Plasmodium coatneyi]|uniref:carnosine N-methyltransferase n=1 Tax=Plasmodium coatneyi TaxID=208452 RepID=A0A1B1DYN4_9APIC|nr:Uncharacterized protein PCOAH_00020230 [Plasmodium coatneyi]ANQ07896.1 Uncharacterized protein PCOAH_00020230 [Plasmodium coatneyi]
MASGSNEENEANLPGGHWGQLGGSEVGDKSKLGFAVAGCNPSEQGHPEEGHPGREESHHGCSCAGYPGRGTPGISDYHREDCTKDDVDTLGDEEERHFCNVCFSFLYYKKYCFYELLRIYRNVSSLTDEQKALLTESIYSKLYKMYLAVLNNYFFFFNILLPQISTHIILHLLAHTVHRGDVVIVEDSSMDEESNSGESSGSVESGTEDASFSSDEEGDLSNRRSSSDGEEKSGQKKQRKKRRRKIIPREEYTINEILNHLTEEEKEKIDKEYNYYNLDARLLCKDNPIVILKEIRSKLISAKEDEGMSKELELNLERSTSADYLDVGYSSGGKTHAGGEQQGGHSPGESHGLNIEGELQLEGRKNLPFPEHYNKHDHTKQEKEPADTPNGKGKSEDIRCGGDAKQKYDPHDERYIADHRKQNSEYAFPLLDGPPGEVRLGEWCPSDEPGGETAQADTDTPAEVVPSGTPLQGEHIPPGRRITSAYTPTMDEYNLLQNMSKVRSTLRQFVRDWSIEGKHERDSAYEPMLKSLDKYLPITDDYVPKILCPGSGLGRLPYEVAKKGYRSQGNEFSYFMLLASNFILNYYNEKESLKIQPYCLNTLNRRRRDDHLKVVTLPDINTYNKAILSTDFSMCAGELIEVYDKEKGSFDGVLTCFFLDTAKNIFLYIRTFANILKPNCLWCNVGPLLYHYSEMTNELSIELSWEEIEVIISKWFTLVEIEWIDNYYTTNVDSMMQVQYHCIFFCAIRNDVPVEEPPMGGPLQDS